MVATQRRFISEPDQLATLSPCEHRTVSKLGRIVCGKIVEGDNEVSPSLCRACPFKAVNCGNLRFSLRQTSPSPLIVRFNGRVEVWDDEPPEVRFEQAACSAKVMPIHHPKQCAGCPLRQALHEPGAPAGVPSPVRQRRQKRRVASVGKVVPFPAPVAAG